MTIARHDALRCVLGLLAAVTPTFRAAVAQTPVRRTFAVIGTDSALERKLETVNEHIRASEWAAAIEFLRKVVSEHRGVLVRVSADSEKIDFAERPVPAANRSGPPLDGPKRFMPVSDYAGMLLSQLPKAGLAHYRESVDAEARRAFDSAVVHYDGRTLEQFVSRFGGSGYGANAVLALGQRAWDRNEPSIARAWWSRLLLDDSSNEVVATADDARAISKADVRARMILCDLASGQRERALVEFARLKESFPQAVGTIAGKTGILVATLDALVADRDLWKTDANMPVEPASTFAGNPRRCYVARGEINIARAKWVRRFFPFRAPYRISPDRHPAHARRRSPSIFPVVHNGLVLVSDSKRIAAWEIATGRPAWTNPADARVAGSNGPVIHETRISEAPLVHGRPVNTLTVAQGRLFARMGSPITVRSPREVVSTRSRIVCLDLLRGQGKLQWETVDRSIAETLVFEGGPLVADGRVYAIARQSNDRMQISVVCLDADAGSVRWVRPLCASLQSPRESSNFATHLIPTIHRDALFCTTDFGALASMDLEDGSIRWITTWPVNDEEIESVDAVRVAPVCASGDLVFAISPHSGEVHAMDVLTGRIHWSRELPEKLDHILGVAQERVIVSGQSLWGLSTTDGRVAWGTRNLDPNARGFGRGLLVDDVVYWPKRFSIEVRSQRTGRPLRAPIDLRARGGSGGNLLVTDGRLIIAEPGRLVAYGDRPGVRKRGSQVDLAAIGRE